MDRAMAERWNEAVAPDDEVWHLGDFARSRSPAEIDALLGILHGRKHLLVGNNDGPATVEAAGWASVSSYAELERDGRRLVLCHYAFRTWNGMGRGSINLHGHSHGRLKGQRNQFDVGVDVFDFRPVPLDAILLSRRPVRGRAGTASTA
jgi:calcineurin-like phosphoesterase family protein